MSERIMCPFCGFKHSYECWACEIINPDETFIEPFECPCGAWWYSAMPDIQEADQ